MDEVLQGALVCPVCKGSLEIRGDELICDRDRIAYPIRDGIPVMLKEAARDLSASGLGDPDAHAPVQGGYMAYERIRALVAPGLKYSQAIYEEVLDRCVKRGSQWLDLGCGRKLLPGWRKEEERSLVARGTVVGMDYDLPSLKKHRSISARVQGNISTLPFADGVFDIVTANMVFEHLDKPEMQLREICRVLKPGGMLVFHTPNIYGYTTLISMLVPDALKGWLIRVLERRHEDDVFKTHYRINSIRAITKMAGENGFDMEEMRMLVTDAQFARIPPVALIELLWIRFLMTRPMRVMRTNIIVRLRKPFAQRTRSTPPLEAAARSQ